MSKKPAKAKAVETEEVSGIASLLDNTVIEGYQIKEWSVRQFSLLYPILKSVTLSLQDAGLTFQNADTFLQENYMAVVDACVSVLPEILEVSLSLTKEQVDEIPATKGSVLGLAILQKNTEHVTSFLGQIKGSLVEPVQPQKTI